MGGFDLEAGNITFLFLKNKQLSRALLSGVLNVAVISLSHVFSKNIFKRNRRAQRRKRFEIRANICAFETFCTTANAVSLL